MKNNICILAVYFGKLQQDFPMWLKSCSWNTNIDFKIVTDQLIRTNLKNVQIVNMTFEDCKSFFQSKFDFKISLNKPYKLCDYKPAYGYIFSDLIKGYDYWGYCDLDMIFGNIRHFITDDILKKYDKILQFGHLSIYRNNKEINTIFMSDKGQINYREVFSNDRIFVFDEIIGIFSLFLKEKKAIYVLPEILDISTYVNSSLLKAWEYDKYLNYDTENKKIQTFLVKDGKTYWVFFEKNKVYFQENIYIHLSSRHYRAISSDNYIISKKGFIPVVNEQQISKKFIKKINKRLPYFFEYSEYWILRIKKSILRRLKKSHSFVHPNLN